MLIGSVGMMVCLAGVGALFQTGSASALLLWLLVGYILFFATSQGAVIWVYISEVFPNRVRAKGQSLGASANWITNALIAWFFPLVAAWSDAIPFYGFAAMMTLQFVLVLWLWPETNGKTLEQIQTQFWIDYRPAKATK
jgi:MFS family permease